MNLRLLGLMSALAGLAGCSGGDEPAVCYERQTMSSADICDLLADACEPPTGELPAISERITVVPDQAAMPEGVVSQTSHNNLDIIWFEGRLYFAFRAAPSHFASEDVYLYVVSTTDQQTWTLEMKLNMRRDLREPRFLAVGDRLFLYFAVLGYTPVAFEPQYAMVTEMEGGCVWSEPEQIFEDGFIPWRARTLDGVSYLIGYIGGENIYEVDGEPLRVYWRKTSDGRTFEPVVPGQDVVLEGGMSETDWAFLSDGTLIAVSRNEAGDEVNGFGSLICRAEANALGDWSCVSDPKKYDSPLVFAHGDDVYLVGRRHVTEDGNYDLGRDDLSLAEQASLYNRSYWVEPKRCSLWQVDTDTLEVVHLIDLPSNGDTCFASVVHLEGDQYLLYNYTSPLDDPELQWVEGQTGPTFIYRLTLTLPSP